MRALGVHLNPTPKRMIDEPFPQSIDIISLAYLVDWLLIALAFTLGVPSNSLSFTSTTNLWIKLTIKYPCFNNAHPANFEASAASP